MKDTEKRENHMKEKLRSMRCPKPVQIEIEQYYEQKSTYGEIDSKKYSEIKSDTG